MYEHPGRKRESSSRSHARTLITCFCSALATAAKYFPNEIIVGNLEPAIIQTQKPDEVYEAFRKVLEEGEKRSGGYIFSPGCEMPPMAPVENVRAMTQAVNDFGWYE
jgi:uroporphyrinogen decarboxylase